MREIESPSSSSSDDSDDEGDDVGQYSSSSSQGGRNNAQFTVDLTVATDGLRGIMKLANNTLNSLRQQRPIPNPRAHQQERIRVRGGDKREKDRSVASKAAASDLTPRGQRGLVSEPNVEVGTLLNGDCEADTDADAFCPRRGFQKRDAHVADGPGLVEFRLPDEWKLARGDPGPQVVTLAEKNSARSLTNQKPGPRKVTKIQPAPPVRRAPTAELVCASRNDAPKDPIDYNSSTPAQSYGVISFGGDPGPSYRPNAESLATQRNVQRVLQPLDNRKAGQLKDPKNYD